MVIPCFHRHIILSICIFIIQTINTHENSDKMKGRGVIGNFFPASLVKVERTGDRLPLASQVQPWGCSFHSSILSNVLLLEDCLKELMWPLQRISCHDLHLYYFPPDVLKFVYIGRNNFSWCLIGLPLQTFCDTFTWPLLTTGLCKCVVCVTVRMYKLK